MKLLRRAASERRETVVPEYRFPQRRHGLRHHELGGLYRIVRVEIVVSLQIAGQINNLRDGVLCWCRVAGR